MRVSLTLSNSKKKLYVYSDEIIELAVEEGGQLRRQIKTALNPRIKAARARDLNLGVFVSYRARA